jgi:phosphoglycolate phosphatase-like HAD superfamily hydrolase
MSTVSTLLLFDVDGTLIRGSRGARLAFARAIETCLGVRVDLSRLISAGKTDLAIMREIIDAHGLGGGFDWAALISAFVEQVGDAVREQPGELCPGVEPLLEALTRCDDMVLALGTGNLERGARAKLGAHDLNRFFATGGFGDDGMARETILRAGIHRAAEHHGRGFDRLVVIGDTPADAEAAALAGAWSLCVATGRFPPDALATAGATMVRLDLTATTEVIGAIRGLPLSLPRP